MNELIDIKRRLEIIDQKLDNFIDETGKMRQHCAARLSAGDVWIKILWASIGVLGSGMTGLAIIILRHMGT